jgi:molecular chaperone GrpE
MPDHTHDDPVNDDEQTGAAAASEGDAAEDASDPAPAAEAVEALRKERDALQDRLLRHAAEFDNYRKRVERERRDLADFVGADVLAGLLPIVDNFERALQAPAGADADSFRKGIEMIHTQMLDLLRKRGVTPIDAVGTDFDPNVHEAVIHEPSEGHRDGEVIAELQRGYTLGDRLLRPAMVKVAKSS